MPNEYDTVTAKSVPQLAFRTEKADYFFEIHLRQEPLTGSIITHQRLLKTERHTLAAQSDTNP